MKLWSSSPSFLFRSLSVSCRRHNQSSLAFAHYHRTTASDSNRIPYTFRTMTSSTTATAAEWQGCIVARLLPDSVDQDYQHLHKPPLARHIDPCSLQPGAGAVSHYRRQSHAIGATSISESGSVPASTTSLEKTATSTESSELGRVTALSLYLYKGGETPTITTYRDETFTLLQMYRDTNEDMVKTLKRMELSVTNKFYPKSKSKKSNHKRKVGVLPVQDRNKPATVSESTATAVIDPPLSPVPAKSKLPPSIWLTDPNNPGSLPMDISNHNNGTFWKDATTGGPVMVQLDLESHSYDDDDDAAAKTTMIRLNVDSCPPTITRVATFQDFSANLFVGVPCRVSTEQLSATRTIVDWYVDGTLVQHDNDLYVPGEDDVDKHVAVLMTPIRECQCENCGCDSSSKCIDCTSHNGEGCQEAYQFERTVEPLPTNTLLQLRPSWTTAPTVPTNQNKSSTNNNSNKNTDTDVRVVTYNILADQNAFKHNKMPVYPYCPKEFLEKKRRMPLILHELVSYQADILCLQEVDEGVFYSLFQPVMEKYGFAGYFSCKSSKGNQEGCAMFWSKSRFGAVGDSSLPVPESDQTTHVLSNLFPSQSDNDDEWTSMKDMAAMLEDRRDLRHVISSRLGHVAQLLTVQEKLTGRRLLVANTHLFYHPLASHIRLMQMYVLCRQVGRELTAANAAVKNNSDDNGNDKDDCLVMMCGDFNSSLTNTAGRLATERHVPANFRDVQEHLRTFQWGRRRTSETGTVSTTPIASAATASTATTATTTVADDFPEMNLPDSFPVLLPALTEIPSFTHYISGFFGALDHILIGQPGLRPVRHAPMPAVRDVARQTAMPSEHLPSDHVSLVCDVTIVQRKEE